MELEQLVPLILPLMLIIIISRERWQKLGNGIALLQLAIYFGVPWLLFTQGLPQRIGIGVNDLIFLLWPSLAILGMYWIRWWTIRPPRTWLDLAKLLTLVRTWFGGRSGDGLIARFARLS